MNLVLSECTLLLVIGLFGNLVCFPGYLITSDDLISICFYLCGIIFDNVLTYSWKRHSDTIFKNIYHFLNVIPITFIHCMLLFIHVEFFDFSIDIKYIPVVSFIFAFGFLFIERRFLCIYKMRDDVRYVRCFPKLFPDDDAEFEEYLKEQEEEECRREKMEEYEERHYRKPDDPQN